MFVLQPFLSLIQFSTFVLLIFQKPFGIIFVKSSTEQFYLASVKVCNFELIYKSNSDYTNNLEYLRMKMIKIDLGLSEL